MADEPRAPNSIQIDRWPVRHFENGRPTNGRSLCWPPSPCDLIRHLPNRLCFELFRTSESEISVLLKTVFAPLNFGVCFLHFSRAALVCALFLLFFPFFLPSSLLSLPFFSPSFLLPSFSSFTPFSSLFYPYLSPASKHVDTLKSSFFMRFCRT